VKTVPKSVVFSCSEPEGFKDAGINTTTKCPNGAVVSGMTFGSGTTATLHEVKFMCCKATLSALTN